MKHTNLIARLGISATAGIGSAVVAALAIATIDLFVTGHGYGSINREVVAWNAVGVHLSVGDVGMLLVMITASGSTWYRLVLAAR